jgi:uridylate kinase
MKIVISLGGSLLTKELTSGNFRKYADVILRLGKNHKIIVICGGGKVCRDYRDVAKGLGADNDQMDFIGIMATHLNASTFSAALGKSGYLVRWKSFKDAMKEVKRNFGKKILVGAGYDIGTSSDYDAAALAGLVKADILINATNIDGVYSADPKIDTSSKKIDKLSYGEFEKIMSKNAQVPGEYRFFDWKATRIIKKYKIKTIFIDGRDPEEIIRAVEGKHHGTTVAEFK